MTQREIQALIRTLNLDLRDFKQTAKTRGLTSANVATVARLTAERDRLRSLVTTTPIRAKK